MVKRKIIEIDEKKCNGCGECIPDCPEGAIQVIDGKARLVSDLFCDGLGACIGSCPKDAIRIIEREAEPHSERKVMERIVKQGRDVIGAHLQHLREHGEEGYLKEATDYLEEKGIGNPLEKPGSDRQLPCGCPGAMLREMEREPKGKSHSARQDSELRQWPVQLDLLPPNAPFFRGSDLLVAADCVGFANPNFHGQLLKGKSLVIGCPKLDDIQEYEEKFRSIIKMNKLKSITVAMMEVPCCYGLYRAVENALAESGKKIVLNKVVVGIDGSIQR